MITRSIVRKVSLMELSEYCHAHGFKEFKYESRIQYGDEAAYPISFSLSFPRIMVDAAGGAIYLGKDWDLGQMKIEMIEEICISEIEGVFKSALIRVRVKNIHSKSVYCVCDITAIC